MHALAVVFVLCGNTCLLYIHVHVGKDENVLSNLHQYGLQHQYIDMLVADAAKCVWRQGELFDAIITDR